MENSRENDEIGAIWQGKTSTGGIMLSGSLTLNGVKVDLLGFYHPENAGTNRPVLTLKRKQGYRKERPDVQNGTAAVFAPKAKEYEEVRTEDISF